MIEIFLKKLFNKENFIYYTGLFFFIGLVIGTAYNYLLYNLLFGVDIFNYVDPIDLIFSWISNMNIILPFVSVVIYFYIIHLITSISIENKLFSFKKSTLLIAVIFSIIFIIYIFTLYKTNSLIHYFIFIFILSLATINTIIYLRSASLFKDQFTIKHFKGVTIFFAFFYIVFGSTYTYKNIEKDNNCIVTLIKGDKASVKDKILNFIGRTGSVTIFYDDKEVLILNNSDISSIKHLK